MDTLWIMGMKKDFEECVKMVEKIDFTMNGLVVLNVFETTIRYLGGLLAAYDLSEGQYPTLLSKAIELGDILYSAFDTPNRMPVMRWEWQKTANGAPIEAAESTLIAEIGSLGLEFTRISQLTKDPKYFDAIQRVYDELEKAQPTTAIPGLWPIILDAKALTFTFNLFTLGGMADSAFEYLPKQYLLVSGRKDQYKNMYESAIEAAKNHLFFRPLVPTEKPLLFSGTAKAILDGPPVLDPQGQHLTCFAGGMVALGAKAFDRREDLEIARQLTEACMWAYESLPSGLMPEVFHTLPCQTGVSKPEDPTQCVWNIEKWHKGITDKFAETDAKVAEPPSAETYVKGKGLPPGFIDVDDARYILRPEAMESLFILYRLTGEQSFADSAWKMFSSIVNATETDIAHAGVKDVRKPMSKDSPDRQANLDDRMESFWTAETLKYAYLAFEEPGVVDLGQWVLNTEAHPLKIE
ncbi:putative class i alpha-mannosidase [Phaeomoniella chlamydospora]|uniref:alpha-1,2-Mannosidase n=1 Tax=Phaeomoniella chlamydospora TaxID=158046 RepID=A0A0G2H1R2_PHACM|nr:putative class i alpha-mannosidase [Phaeomoniella chlamydospora]